MKLCPACASHYPDDANFCPMDATRLVPVAHSEPVPPVQPATLLAGHFALGPRLESTLTGELFQATDRETGQPVHLKLIDSSALPNTTMADRALREFRQLGKLKSPHIQRILDQGKHEDGRVYVVLEPLTGVTLDEFIRRAGPLDVVRAQRIFGAIGEALIEAQKVGVIHRDLSPRSILLVGEQIKVCEFGCGAPITDRIFGTPAFLSPEQAEGRPVDQRTNIYSLGAVLYYILTGVAPFQGDTESLLQQHLHAHPLPPSQLRPEISPEVDKLVLKALEKSGGRRHLTLRQLVTDVAALGTESEPQSRRTQSLRRATSVGLSPPAGTSTALIQSQPVAPVPDVAAAPPRPHFGDKTVPSMPVMAEPAAASQPPPRPVAAPAATASPEPRRVAATTATLTAAPVAPPQPAISPPAAASGAVPARVEPQPSLPRVGAEEPSHKPITVAPSPSGRMAVQPSTGHGEAVPRPGFRETGWFKQSVLEADHEGGEATAPTDAGALTSQDQQRYSLRTGRTESMAAVKSHHALPGEQMSEADMLAEVDSSRKWLMVAGAAIALLTLVAGIYFLFLRAPSPETPASRPPSPTSSPAH